MSFSFWGLTVWSIRGLESTGELIGKLSLSECSELIDWLRNCEREGRKPIIQSSQQVYLKVVTIWQIMGAQLLEATEIERKGEKWAGVINEMTEINQKDGKQQQKH